MLRRCTSCSSRGDSMMCWALRQPGKHWCTAGAAYLASAGCAAGGIKHGYCHTLALYPWTARFLGLSFSVKRCWFLNGGNRLKHMMCEKKYQWAFLPSETYCGLSAFRKRTTNRIGIHPLSLCSLYVSIYRMWRKMGKKRCRRYCNQKAK